MKTSCSHCHAISDVEDQYEGAEAACPSCGQSFFISRHTERQATQAYQHPPSHPFLQTRTSGLAIAALVLGIVSLIGGAFFILPTILAIVFGHIASSQCKKNPALAGRGMAIAGYVTGYVSIIFIAGIMAAMAIPAYQKVRVSSQEKAIYNNMRQLHAAADQFYLERGMTYVMRSEIVGPDKYIRTLVPVAGEAYPDVFQMGKPVVVVLPDGRKLRYPE